MADSVVSSLVQKLSITNVRGFVVTDRVSDGVGGFLRRLQILGEPTDANGNPTVVLEILCSADAADKLKITAPTQEF